MSQQSAFLFFCTINNHHTERNPLLCILVLVSPPSRLDEGNVNSVPVCCSEMGHMEEFVLMCVYEKERQMGC